MIASLLFALSYRRFLAACRNPLVAQAERLQRILRQAADTDIGRQHDFTGLSLEGDPVRLIQQFQARVPVRTHREMRSDLDAVYAGDWNRLCPSRPVFFSMTAGSTGRFKYVPVTAELRREIRAASLVFYGAIEQACPALRGLRSQFLVGSGEGGMSPGGVPQGFASGFNYQNLPGILRDKFVLPYWIFTLPDAEDRSYAAGRILAGDRRLGSLSAISPVNLINLRQSLERNADLLFADIAAGTLTLRGKPAVAGAFRTRPDPVLASSLEQSWRKNGTLPHALLFPSLQLLVCWQGGNMSYYLPELDTCFEGARHFEFPISASEGVFAIPHRVDRAGGILAVTSHFLEFLPDDPGTAPSPALRADQLREGRQYRIVLTNSGGLYRYDMEDIIRVRGFYRRTPIIEFVCRADRQVSVANERVTELDVTIAMQATSQRRGAWFPEFLFVPCSDRRYRVLVDGEASAAFAGPPDSDPVRAFAIDLDRQLRVASRGYDFERDDALLEPLEVVLTAPGELRDYLRQRIGDQRLPNAQLKPIHLTNQFDLHTSFSRLAIHAA